jgi:predicted nucleic acid-binding protein
MKKVFVDTLYWLAIVRPRDPWQTSAKNAKSSIGNSFMVSTDEVLTEFLNALSAGGEHMRKQAVLMVKKILDNPNVKVIPQSRDSFLKGIELYEQCADKGYSLTDCISMNVIAKESINEVLTNDKHFEQEGYVVLIKHQ